MSEKKIYDNNPMIEADIVHVASSRAFLEIYHHKKIAFPSLQPEDRLIRIALVMDGSEESLIQQALLKNFKAKHPAAIFPEEFTQLGKQHIFAAATTDNVDNLLSSGLMGRELAGKLYGDIRAPSALRDTASERIV